MATNRECNCISIVTDILNENNTLNTTSIIAIHHGNLKYKKNITPGPISSKGLYDDMSYSGKNLLDKIPEYHRECGVTLIPEEQNRFDKATKTLELIFKKDKEVKHDDIHSIFYSSVIINDVLSRAIKKHNLIQCR